MLLIGVSLYELARNAGKPPSESSAWGWNRPGALSEEVPPSRYFARLADEAEEWFKQRPEEKSALTKRLEELRLGCSTLIAAPHRSLANKDRQWLIQKCQAWAKKFDQQLAALQSGEDPLQVRSRTDETINKLVAALRSRAKELTGA